MLKKEITIPLIQVERNESLFGRFLRDLGMNFAIEYYLVFINPEFTLYNAPIDKRIILPTQLNRFMKKLHMKNPRTQERHLNFAKQLVSEHVTDPPPFMELPKYCYEGLEKGVFCAWFGRRRLCKEFLQGSLSRWVIQACHIMSKALEI